MFPQIQHAKCFIYKDKYIKDTGKNEEIVNKYPRYKKALVRMGFRTPELSNSKKIGTPGSEKISRETPGRFYLKRDTLEEMQAPYLTDKEAEKLLEGYKYSDWKTSSLRVLQILRTRKGKK